MSDLLTNVVVPDILPIEFPCDVVSNISYFFHYTAGKKEQAGWRWHHSGSGLDWSRRTKELGKYLLHERGSASARPYVSS